MEWHLVRWYGGTVVRLVVIERSSSKSAHVYKNTIIDGAGSAPQNNGITRDTNCDRLQVVAGSVPPYHRTTYFFNACTEARTPGHRHNGTAHVRRAFPPPMTWRTTLFVQTCEAPAHEALPPLAHPLCPTAFLILPDTSQPTPAVCSAQ